MSERKSISNAFRWMFIERISVQGIQFILQIALARLLNPEYYGELSIMIIFVNIAQVFVQNGFATALIQNKDVTEDDFSTVFWVSLGVVSGLYIVLFLFAPVIANFYNMPDIIVPFRVISAVLFPSALNSIQTAKISRELDFKKLFYSNIGGIIVAGISGIILAISGAGIWALVAQTLLNTSFSCLVMWFVVKWRPRWVVCKERLKVLISFGWKLLVSSLLENLYQQLSSLVIGKKYDADMLAYYDRGRQFPQFLINALNSTVQGVLLPAMSAEQEHKEKVKSLMRQSISLSCYIVFPMMAGLAAVATPMVRVLLTDKWLPCVPFLQIFCFTQAFFVLNSANLQAINAMGRSDIYLKLEVMKKIVGVTALVIALVFFDSPIAIALTGVVTTPIGLLINASPNKKLVNYSYLEQLKDIFPSFLLSMSMFGVVYAVQLLNFSSLFTLVLQIITGILFYIGVSHFLKLEPYERVLQIIKKRITKN